MENEEQVELSFMRRWDPSLAGKFVPLNIDKRFALIFFFIILYIYIFIYMSVFRLACMNFD